MSINSISSNLIELLSEVPGTSKVAQAPSEGFSNILTDAINTASDTDAEDKASSIELLSGKSDDFSGLLLDAQKAEIALNFSLQIRNKVLDAYKEIMNMQI